MLIYMNLDYMLMHSFIKIALLQMKTLCQGDVPLRVWAFFIIKDRTSVAFEHCSVPWLLVPCHRSSLVDQEKIKLRKRMYGFYIASITAVCYRTAFLVVTEEVGRGLLFINGVGMLALVEGFFTATALQGYHLKSAWTITSSYYVLSTRCSAAAAQNRKQNKAT